LRYYILSWNGVCQIRKFSSDAQLSEINKAVFGIPYGPKCLKTVPQWQLPVAIDTARAAGFTEAIVDGEQMSLEVVGMSGVS
jgi:hypothetical protein